MFFSIYSAFLYLVVLWAFAARVLSNWWSCFLNLQVFFLFAACWAISATVEVPWKPRLQISHFIQELKWVVNIHFSSIFEFEFIERIYCQRWLFLLHLVNENSSKQRSQQNSRASLSNTQRCFVNEWFVFLNFESMIQWSIHKDRHLLHSWMNQPSERIVWRHASMTH